jgi:hypothetical protein
MGEKKQNSALGIDELGLLSHSLSDALQQPAAQKTHGADGCEAAARE